MSETTRNEELPDSKDNEFLLDIPPVEELNLSDTADLGHAFMDLIKVSAASKESMRRIATVLVARHAIDGQSQDEIVVIEIPYEEGYPALNIKIATTKADDGPRYDLTVDYA